MRMAARLDAMRVDKYRGLTRKSGKRYVWTGKVRLDRDSLETPKRWKKPRRVFVNSMSDLFHEDVSISFVRKVWEVMEQTPQHTYQILTKRPDRMRQVLAGNFPYLLNVWLGTSVENADALPRLDDLRAVRAAIRFVSFEPLIGPVSGANLSEIHWAIVGGESGPRARPMKTEWVDDIATECQRAGVVFFFKQWGGTNKKLAGRSYRGRVWDDFPEVRI